MTLLSTGDTVYRENLCHTADPIIVKVTDQTVMGIKPSTKLPYVTAPLIYVVG